MPIARRFCRKMNLRESFVHTQGLFLESPGNFSGPVKLFLVNRYLKMEKCICLELLV